MVRPRTTGTPQNPDPQDWRDRQMRRRLLPGFEATSSRFSHIVGWFVYVAGLVLIAGFLPPEVFIPGSTSFLLIMGVIGIWRYSWGGLHFFRSHLYQRLYFPRIRERADRFVRPPPHLYILVTSFRMTAEVNAAVYRRLIEEIHAYGHVRATIVACVTDPADFDILQRVIRRTEGAEERIRLLAVTQRGRGKRDALAEALRVIAREHPLPTAQVVLMDGDSLLGHGCLRKACSVLMSEPDVGAVTVENSPLVKGSMLALEWYRLRMAQRHNLMCSVSLSRKVMVLTGRFSVFRANIACRPDFILAVEQDHIRHWRLGKIGMLTGDDKSTWYMTLKGGWNMLYVPDAIVHPLEEPPTGSFIGSSISLMSRWFGNMVRNNGRALALGPKRTGWFLWLCLFDQRISMWTTLMAPTFATMASVLFSPVFFLIYIFWIASTRALYTLALFWNSGRLHPLFPLLLYYTQVVGSVVKVIVTFHPYRQKWTRQNISAEKTPLDVLRELTSNIYAIVMFVVFILFVGYVSGVFSEDRRLTRDDMWYIQSLENMDLP